MELAWPEEPAHPARPDWLDTVSGAADLALLGIVLMAAALPVVTSGAALAVGSMAIDQWCTDRRLPPARELARCFVRGILPGTGVLAAAIVVAAVFWLDLTVLDRGVVPGGPLLRTVTLLILALAAGLAGLIVVRLGQRRGQGWRAAAVDGWRTAIATPLLPLALAGDVAVAVLIASMMPVVVPVLAGIVLLGLHVVTRRLSPVE